MFTGLIETTGEVLSNEPKQGAHRLVISCDLKDLQIGESISVNGVCLTLLPSKLGQLSFDVSPETLSCTTLAQLTPGTAVNLERALLVSMRFGGHYVSGHVDTIAQVSAVTPIDGCMELELNGFKPKEMLYLIPKGSICVEGVSLTINTVREQSMNLMLIPHTLSKTTLSCLKAGQEVNIEFDYLARIVAHQLNLAAQFQVTP